MGLSDPRGLPSGEGGAGARLSNHLFVLSALATKIVAISSDRNCDASIPAAPSVNCYPCVSRDLVAALNVEDSLSKEVVGMAGFEPTTP